MIPVRLYTYVATFLVAFALGATGGWVVQGWRFGKKLATIETNQLTAIAAGIQGARDQEAARFKNLQEAQNAAAIRARTAQADAAAARTELDRLRDAIAASPSCSAPIQPGSASGVGRNPAGVVLSECAAALVEMARHADGHANDVKLLLDAWPKNTVP